MLLKVIKLRPFSQLPAIVFNDYPKVEISGFRFIKDTKTIRNVVLKHIRLWCMQVLLTWHNTNPANEWGILNGSLSVVFLILFSYQRFECGCDLWLISKASEVNSDQH